MFNVTFKYADGDVSVWANETTDGMLDLVSNNSSNDGLVSITVTVRHD